MRPDELNPPLVGLAHGSRHPGAQSSVTDLMNAARGLGGMPTAGAFLDLTEPDLTDVAVGLGRLGHHRAVVVPLLFTEAFHATVDVPQAVRGAADVSGVELLTADILGTGDDMVNVVRTAMEHAGIGTAETILLVSVGSSNPEANEAIHDLARRLGRGRSGGVAAAFGTQSPRPTDVLQGLADPVAVVPLFVSPGLLLGPLARMAADRGMRMSAPLGNLIAPILVERFRKALLVDDHMAVQPCGSEELR